MMVLTLLTKQIDGEFTVYWKTGLRRGGELKVDLGEQYDKLPEQQKPIAAELYAIHHLLSVKEVRIPAIPDTDTVLIRTVFSFCFLCSYFYFNCPVCSSFLIDSPLNSIR